MSEELKRDYRVSEEIGKGRFGIVYKCFCRSSGEAFAVKSIDKRSIVDDLVDRQCLYNEAKVMFLLSTSPRILRIFDVYEDDDFLHLVLELCNSSDLFQRLDSMPVFSEADAIAVMVCSSFSSPRFKIFIYLFVLWVCLLDPRKLFRSLNLVKLLF